MKKNKRKVLKLLKWGSLVILGYWVLTILIFGQTNLDSKTGMLSFRWSGLDALFSDEPFGFASNEQYKTHLNGIDGPYIFDDTKFWVNKENELVQEKFDRSKPIRVNVNNVDNDTFEVTLKDSFQKEVESYDLPTRLIALSDIEGNYNALFSFLLNNKVIDENYNWTFGDGHLVLNGDYFDRGQDVNQVLWLIYMLEEKAIKQHGRVHFINGNHEMMNLYGDVSNTDLRYIEVGKQISHKKDWNEAVTYLYSNNSELGEWLRTKNIISKIGSYIFVHGGLNKQHVNAELRLSEMNTIAKKYYGKEFKLNPENAREALVAGYHNSPYWDRSLAMNMMYQTMFYLNGAPSHKTSEVELDEILDYYDAEKIVIGHSVVGDVTADYHGKVIKIDVKHGQEKNSSKTEGLLIANGIEYRVNGLGEKVQL